MKVDFLFKERGSYFTEGRRKTGYWRGKLSRRNFRFRRLNACQQMKGSKKGV